MDVFYAGHPNNHHLILKTISGDLTNHSLLRFDLYHDDLDDESFPQGSYVSKLVRGYYFRDIFWVNKPFDDGLFRVIKYSHGSLSVPLIIDNTGSLITYLRHSLSSRVVLDVDPVVLDGYPWGDRGVTDLYDWAPESGFLDINDLALIIDGLSDKFSYAFFASRKGLAFNVLLKAGLRSVIKLKPLV